MENINSALQNTKKQISYSKSKVWDNKDNRMNLLFLISAILVCTFVYYQFARRHYSLSAFTQRHHNYRLKSKL